MASPLSKTISLRSPPTAVRARRLIAAAAPRTTAPRPPLPSPPKAVLKAMRQVVCLCNNLLKAKKLRRSLRNLVCHLRNPLHSMRNPLKRSKSLRNLVHHMRNPLK